MQNVVQKNAFNELEFVGEFSGHMKTSFH